MDMKTTKTGDALISVETSADAGVGMPKARRVLVSPKKKPSRRPVRQPSRIVPMITGICKMVTLIKPSGMIPSGVKPRTSVSATNRDVMTNCLRFMCFMEIPPFRFPCGIPYVF